MAGLFGSCLQVARCISYPFWISKISRAHSSHSSGRSACEIKEEKKGYLGKIQAGHIATSIYISLAKGSHMAIANISEEGKYIPSLEGETAKSYDKAYTLRVG